MLKKVDKVVRGIVAVFGALCRVMLFCGAEDEPSGPSWR